VILKRTYLFALAMLAATLVAPGAAVSARAPEPQFEAPTLAELDFGNAAATRIKILTTAPRRLAGVAWQGGTYTLRDGQKVSVYVSSSYPDAEPVARKWADFFGGLVHGSEISAMKAYFAPFDEVQQLCESEEAIGCYGGQELVVTGDSSTGVPPASIAAHEYGHHIAANRLNAPWAAIDWGTKRWASELGICSRVKSGTAFPGDEGSNYSLNPGEGFAESYRVLVETNGTAQDYGWPIVDPSFRPTAQALEALREDVLKPWMGPTTTTIAGKFLRRSRTWSTQVATPLDGDLRLRLTAPAGGASDVALLSGDGQTVLATGSWSSSGGKSLEYRICGARSVKVRVARGGAAARFTLRVVVP
jgi:hypothetical protein